MAKTWCLLPKYVEEFKKALKDGTIDPFKIAEMDSVKRREYLSKFVGEENAQQVNGLYESKLLLKNQKAGMISWAKKVGGMTPEVRRDMIAKIERLDKVLNTKEADVFYKDLASTKLGIDINRTEAQTISDLSKKSAKLRKMADPKTGKFKSETKRLRYGASQVELENYINDLKLQSKAVSFKDQPIRKIIHAGAELPGLFKSSVASLDNSMWGRQGVKALLDPTTSDIWAKNFITSWRDIGKQIVAKGDWYKSGDDAVLDAIKADIYSRPNAISGKYKAGGYGLDVLSEEAYPSSLPEKIPLLGRLFKASEVAYNGGALKLRADLADRLIGLAEKNGVNTLSPAEARPLGNLIGSLTGRGPNFFKMTGTQSKIANTVMFSEKFLEANIDTLISPAKYAFYKLGEATKTIPKGNAGERFARKEAAKRTLRMVGSLAALLTLAAAINKNSVEPDPRSSNFGKIKIFGHWVDVSGGMAGIVTLSSRLMPTYHDGKKSYWKKTANGEYQDLGAGGFGTQSALDVFDSFLQGKLSPLAGVVRNSWAGQDYNGQPVTLENVLKNQVPLGIQTFNQIKSDPKSSFVLGSMILDGIGFANSTQVETNLKAKVIPEGKTVSNEDFVKTVAVYAKAFGTDPETAFNRMFTGQKIVRVTNGTVVVQRMTLKDSQAVKKAGGGDNPNMKLDHTISLQIGGSNDPSNLKLVTTAEWKSYTPVEDALGRALKNNKISKKEAQSVLLKFKGIKDSGDRKAAGDKIRQQYK